MCHQGSKTHGTDSFLLGCGRKGTFRKTALWGTAGAEEPLHARKSYATQWDRTVNVLISVTINFIHFLTENYISDRNSTVTQPRGRQQRSGPAPGRAHTGAERSSPPAPPARRRAPRSRCHRPGPAGLSPRHPAGCSHRPRGEALRAPCAEAGGHGAPVASPAGISHQRPRRAARR